MLIHLADMIIVVVYMAAVTLLGVWIGRGNKGIADYQLGSRQIPWWGVLGSIIATETSTVTFLSVPGITWAEGGNFCFLQLAIGYVIGRILIAVFLLPMYFKGQLFTAYEVLHDRFGGLTQKTASLVFLVTRNLGDGLRLFLTALVLDKVIGLNLPTCIVLVGVLTMAYTYFGGMKAVIWTDCIQLVVYIAGGIAALLLIVSRLPGGWDQLIEFGTAEQKFTLFDFRPDLTLTYTFWAGLFGGTMLTLGTHGTDQMMVQRYLCTANQRDAGKALISSGIVVFLQFALFLLLGTGLACYYKGMASPPEFSSKDQVLATFIVREMPIGMVGLTLAAVFSAAMSTLSSSLSSSAGAVVNDFLKTGRSSEQQMTASRWLTLMFGVIQIGVGIAASQMSQSVIGDALAIAGFSAGILLGVFALGVATKHVGQRSAMVGMICGTIAMCGIKFGTMVAWPYYSVVGASVTVAGGLICQQVFPGKRRDSTANEIR